MQNVGVSICGSVKRFFLAKNSVALIEHVVVHTQTVMYGFKAKSTDTRSKYGQYYRIRTIENELFAAKYIVVYRLCALTSKERGMNKKMHVSTLEKKNIQYKKFKREYLNIRTHTLTHFYKKKFRKKNQNKYT